MAQYIYLLQEIGVKLEVSIIHCFDLDDFQLCKGFSGGRSCVIQRVCECDRGTFLVRLRLFSLIISSKIKHNNHSNPSPPDTMFR